ncbi:hypothetical protein [Flavobacterium sp. A45]|uniref:hypothetical protein n=1 Tax=Flavobacterium sp. A45 TaxID=1945862 RepID=UPI000986E912|nr:hypothetical protein [Flavobacterium sp. A45]OOG69965.1 hypothetical protein B0E44_11545 [Flavobacterium sp. A45]
MAKTVDSAFIEFNRDFVNLDSEKTKTARSSRDWLFTQLNNFPINDESFPLKYIERHIKYGSFSRNTKIRELDDIDVIYCLHADSAHYSESFLQPKTYYIHTENSGDRLKNLSDNNKLNSIKVVNKFVSSLSNISQYKSAKIHRRQEAATLNLTSYDWTFDIVPAFYTKNGFYLIPDGKGNWKATNPALDDEYITNLNKNYNYSIHQLVRTLKYWNRRAKMPTMSSFLFENFVLNFVESKSELSKHIDINLINFWSYLKTAVYNNVNDPKGIDSNINQLSFEDKNKIFERAKDSYEKGYEAYRLETEDKNQNSAINKWKEIFGNDFPPYN